MLNPIRRCGLRFLILLVLPGLPGLYTPVWARPEPGADRQVVLAESLPESPAFPESVGAGISDPTAAEAKRKSDRLIVAIWDGLGGFLVGLIFAVEF